MAELTVEQVEAMLAEARRAARIEALEEAARVCEIVGEALTESYGTAAECIRTGEECAASIRALIQQGGKQ